MGKIESQPIPVRLHSKLIDVSTPHVNADIADHTLKAYNLKEGIFKVKVPMLFAERLVGGFDASSEGIKYWHPVRFKVLASDVIEGNWIARITANQGNSITDVFLYNHNYGGRIATARANSGEVEVDIDLLHINDDDVLQMGVAIYQAGGSGAATWVYMAMASWLYQSKGVD